MIEAEWDHTCEIFPGGANCSVYNSQQQAADKVFHLCSHGGLLHQQLRRRMSMA